MPTTDENKIESFKLSRVALKILDALVFAIFIYLGIQSYQVDHKMFDLISLLAMVYVAIRKPDINTLSLIFILFIASLIPAIFIYGNEQLGGFALYSMLFLVNIAGIIAIWSRPFMLLRYGPRNWMQQHAAAIRPNKQDQILGLLFSLQALWQLMQFLEHLIRHRNNIGLETLFGNWLPMFLYNIYQTGQFGFAILTLLILFIFTRSNSRRI